MSTNINHANDICHPHVQAMGDAIKANVSVLTSTLREMGVNVVAEYVCYPEGTDIETIELHWSDEGDHTVDGLFEVVLYRKDENGSFERTIGAMPFNKACIELVYQLYNFLEEQPDDEQYEAEGTLSLVVMDGDTPLPHGEASLSHSAQTLQSFHSYSEIFGA